MIQPNGSWPERNSELSFCGKCQHFNIFSNTAVFKKSPNSCCWPTFLASSMSHNAKTQQKGCLFTVRTHHVYKTCTLFLADSSGGSTISSAFHSQSSPQARGIPSWMCTKATINQPRQEDLFSSALLPQDNVLGSIMSALCMNHWPLQGPFFRVMISSSF